MPTRKQIDEGRTVMQELRIQETLYRGYHYGGDKPTAELVAFRIFALRKQLEVLLGPNWKYFV